MSKNLNLGEDTTRETDTNDVLPVALLHAEAPERLLSLQVLNSSIVTDRSLVDSQSIAITHHLCASNQEGASLP